MGSFVVADCRVYDAYTWSRYYSKSACKFLTALVDALVSVHYSGTLCGLEIIISARVHSISSFFFWQKWV